jgi:hypothetical protein
MGGRRQFRKVHKEEEEEEEFEYHGMSKSREYPTRVAQTFLTFRTLSYLLFSQYKNGVRIFQALSDIPVSKAIETAAEVKEPF